MQVEQTATTATTESAPVVATQSAASDATVVTTTAQETVAPSEASTVPGEEGNKSAEAHVVPETYAEFTDAESKPLDSVRSEWFTKTAKELKLTQEQAQQLVKIGLNREVESKSIAEEASNRWLSELPSDKEFGGDKLTENIAIAKRAIAEFGTPELSALLNETKLGNHPEVIRAFYRAGLKISPDNKFVAGGSGNQKAGGKDPAKALFPNQNS